MILQNPTTTANSNLPAGSAFTIAATREAFEALSGGLYERRPEAILRELLTNAADAHVDANVDPAQAVHVQLPTPYDPTLSVRDYGVGMSHNTVMGLYATYFSSTKTNTNTTTGAFGLGSKSPLSLVDDFTVTTRTATEPAARIYLVHLDNGTPTVTCMGTDTQHTTGTTVSLTPPSHTHNEFHDAYNRVTPFIARPVTTNAPHMVTWRWSDTRRRLPNGLYYGLTPTDVIRRQRYAFLLVQGSVAYTLETSLFGSKFPSGFSSSLEALLDQSLNKLGMMFKQSDNTVGTFTVEVPLGTVRPALSRENLSLDDDAYDILVPILTDVTRRITTNERSRRLLTLSPHELAAVDLDAYVAKYNDPAPHLQKRHRLSRRTTDHTPTFHRLILRKGRWEKKTYTDWSELHIDSTTGVFAVHADNLALLRRHMKGYIRRGTYTSLLVYVYHHDNQYTRLLNNRTSTRCYNADTGRNQLLPAPAHWDKHNYPLLRDTSPGRRQRRTIATNYSCNSDSTPISRNTVLDRIAHGQRYLLRSDSYRMNTAEVNYCTQHGILGLKVLSDTEKRTKAYAKIVEHSAETLRYVRDAVQQAIHAALPAPRDRALAYVSTELHTNSVIHRLMDAYPDTPLDDLPAQRVRALLYLTKRYDVTVKAEQLTPDERQNANRILEALTKNASTWYPALTLCVGSLNPDQVNHFTKAYVVGSELLA